MIGHGRPTTVLSPAPRALAAVVAALCAAALCSAESIDVRLRIAWGSGAQAPQKWSGVVMAPGTTLADVQPLGIEADEAAALQLVENQIVVAPLVARAFDGCDVTIKGDDAALVTIRLQNSSATQAKEVQVPLGKLATELYRAPLDDLGGYLLVQRAPGDRLRVIIDRDHMVFDPDEKLRFDVIPDVGAELAESPLTLELRLRGVDGGATLWQANYALDSANPDWRATLKAVELRAPAAEGAYRLNLAVRRPTGFTSKLVPWEQNGPIATRDVEFVVINPKARLPRLTDTWETVQTIDPTSSKWWQRVPQWTQLDRLPVISSPRSLGNVKPVPRAGTNAGLVELSAPPAGAEYSWQAYPLAIGAVGEPHAVEIDLPEGDRQQLAVSVIEPDAAGRVQTFGRDATLYHERPEANSATTTTQIGKGRQRIVFWPRTTSPLLLLANHSSSRPAAYGTIRVLRRTVEAAPTSDDVTPTSDRLAAAYLGSPRWPDSLGVREQLDGDGSSGLCVDGWGTFLEAGARLAQQLHADGFNAAIVCVTADGSSLAAIEGLGTSPRYDTGRLSSNGGDVMRKDVLEALLRVFDREGLRLIPLIELAAPMPALEAVRRGGDAQSNGAECIGLDGRTWREAHAGQALGAHYNLLNPQMQSALTEVLGSMAARYGKHPAMAGVALELAGHSYGVLPGRMWCLDDATTAQFASVTSIELPAAGPDRFRIRADAFAGIHAAPWVTWRQQQLTRLYGDLAARLQQTRESMQLIVSTENLFVGPETSRPLRQAMSGRGSLNDATAELGVDLEALAATAGVCVLRPRRSAYDESLEARAVDLHVTSSPELDQLVARHPISGELFYNAPRRLRLASFDAASPFGANKTHLTVSLPGHPTGDVARMPVATALAGRDFYTLAEGGELAPLVEDDSLIRIRRLFQQLPGTDAEVRLERRQPATLRVYRTDSATTVCLINESPWPIEIELPLEFSAPTVWHELGSDAAAASTGNAASSTGTSVAGAEAWKFTLPAYGVAARRYDAHSVRIGALAAVVGEAARAGLQARIDEIEQRKQALVDFERAYAQLQNPDFEQLSADGRMFGWQPRIGSVGAVDIDATIADSGARSLHLRSQDELGVAAQSLLFPIPATGQLVVRSRVRVAGLSPSSRVYAWVEYDEGGVSQRQFAALGDGRLGDEWTQCEFEVDDLPIADVGQMRIQFHLAGPGEAWVDSVELLDLRFSAAQRRELMKRMYAARTDLNEGRLVDCLRRVDGYWPQYLVENLPVDVPTTPATPGAIGPPTEIRVAARPEEAAPAKQKADEPGLGGRVRRYVPGILR